MSDESTPAPDPAPAADPATAPTPKKKDCAARLAALFPQLFGMRAIKPLKLRIQADIQQRAPGEFSRTELSAFLHRYTGSTAYLEALLAARARFDLDGQPAGEPSEEHLAAARTELDRRRALHDARRREQDALQQARRREDEEQRRSRLALLRAFESSPLSRANFCALKGLEESALDGLLEQARREAAERPQAPPPHAVPRPSRPPQRPPRGPQRPGRGGKPPAGAA